MIQLQAIIFDFDGVIVDSEPLHFRSFRDTLAEEGIDLAEQDYFTRYLGLSDAAAFDLIREEHARRWDRHDVVALMTRKAARFEQLEQTSSVVFPGADTFVRAAAALVPIAVASGARRPEVLRMLDRADLTRWFTAIVGAEDVAASKPAPDLYLEALKRLSAAASRPVVPSHCVAIEDSARGLESARAAGLRTVAVRHSFEGTVLSGADFTVHGLASLNVTDLQDLVSNTPQRLN